MKAIRVVILQTGSVAEGLQPEHGDYPEMFLQLFEQAGLPRGQVSVIDATSEALPTEALADAYVITGSRHGVYEPLPWIQPLADFVALALGSGRRVLGVCFGHQLLAHYFGGAVAPFSGGWRVGVQHNQALPAAGVDATDESDWLESMPAQLSMISSHQDQVFELPAGAQLLATHPGCAHAVFLQRHDGGGIALGLQGHPEFSRAYITALMQERRARIGEAAFAEGMASLTEPTNSDVIARWLLDFLRWDPAPKQAPGAAHG